MSEKFLITSADGDDDADEGVTKLELLEMLAAELGYSLTKDRRQGRESLKSYVLGDPFSPDKLARAQGWLKREGLRAMFAMQVHDELVMWVPPEELDQVSRKMSELLPNVSLDYRWPPCVGKT
jgi:hypothetical protein